MIWPGALAKAGRIDRAEQVTRGLTEPGSIARATSALIAHLDQGRARRLPAWALTASRLDMMLPVIAEVDPPILLRPGDEVQPVALPGIDGFSG